MLFIKNLQDHCEESPVATADTESGPEGVFTSS